MSATLMWNFSRLSSNEFAPEASGVDDCDDENGHYERTSRADDYDYETSLRRHKFMIRLPPFLSWIEDRHSVTDVVL